MFADTGNIFPSDVISILLLNVAEFAVKVDAVTPDVETLVDVNVPVIDTGLFIATLEDNNDNIVDPLFDFNSKSVVDDVVISLLLTFTENVFDEFTSEIKIPLEFLIVILPVVSLLSAFMNKSDDVIVVLVLPFFRANAFSDQP